ncbi:putative ribonuclease H-like domain-containing protein [Tanacetum coccineum]
MDEFCGQKGIKREYSIARTRQQNGVVERKNRTLIEAARNMLADSLLATTPYELIIGRAPSISFMRPFGCPVTILNTLDPLGKFDGKAEEGFLVGYSVNSKAFRVFNTETRKVEENLHVNFLENKPNVAGQGPNWLFDIDSLTNSMNYQPVTAGNQTNKNAGPQETNGNTGLKKNVDAGQTEEENVSTQQYIVFPLWSSISSNYKSSDDKAEDDTFDDDACKKTVQEPASEYDQALKNVLDKMMDQEKEATKQSYAVRKSLKLINTASVSRTFSPVGPSSGPSFVPFDGSFPIDVANLPYDPLMPELEDTAKIRSTGIFGNAYDDHDLETLNTPYADQSVGAEADFNNMEPSTIVEAMQEELLQFKIQKRDIKSAFLYGTIEEEVYICQPPVFVELEFPEKVYKVEKALYGLHQAPRAWYETLSTYLLDNGFHKRQIDKTLFIKRLKGDILLIMHNRFKMSSMGELTFFLGLQVKQKEDGIFISQDKYVGEILKKFGLSSIRTVSIPMETNKALTKDEDVTMQCKKQTVVANSTTEAEHIATSHCRGQVLCKRGRDTKIPQSGGPPIKVSDEAVHKELGDRIERAATTASSLEVEQDSGSGPRTATAETSANGEVELTATINGQVKTITEASLRRHLKLEDDGGVTTLPNSEIFEKLALMGKVFSNMKRVSRGYSRIYFALFTTMISALETSPSRITSSPSLSPQIHTPVSTSSTSQPPNTQPTPDAEEAVLMPYESPLYSVHSLGCDKGSLSLNELTDLCTSLSNKVQSLETELKETKQTYNSALTQLIRRVQKLEHIIKASKSRRRARVVESNVPLHAVDEGRNDDTQIYDLLTEQLGVFSAATALADAAKRRRSVEIGQTYTRRRRSISTGSGRVSTASRTVSIADVSTTSELGSTASVKAKDKGKAIMQESEPLKESKRGFKEEVSAEHTQAQQIDWSDLAVLRYHAQLNRPYSVAEVRKNMVMYLKNQGGYKMNYFKGMKYEDIRHIFEKVWDQIQSFAPMDSEKEKDSEKKGSRKKSLARKRAGEKQSEEIPREEFAMEIESFATKYLIVDWKTHVLIEYFMYYQIFRADGSAKNYKIFGEMLDDFDR